MSDYNESSNEAQLPSAGGIEQQSKFFPESNIMKDNKHLESVLNKWYGNDKQSWRLVYRASDNNHSAAAFHENCDGIAPLYVIALVRK